MFFLAPNKKAAKEMCSPNSYGYKRIVDVFRANESAVGVYYEMFYWSQNQKLFMRDAKLCGLEIHFVKLNGKHLPVAVGDLSNLKTESVFKTKFSKRFNNLIAYVKD